MADTKMNVDELPEHERDEILKFVSSHYEGWDQNRAYSEALLERAMPFNRPNCILHRSDYKEWVAIGQLTAHEFIALLIQRNPATITTNQIVRYKSESAIAKDYLMFLRKLEQCPSTNKKHSIEDWVKRAKNNKIEIHEDLSRAMEDYSTEIAPKRKRGRKPEYNWAGMNCYLDQQFEERGELDSTVDSEWGKVKHVAEAARVFFRENCVKTPGDTALMGKIRNYLKLRNATK